MTYLSIGKRDFSQYMENPIASPVKTTKGIRTLQFQVSREERKIELQEVRETQTLLKEDHHTKRRLVIGPTLLADYVFIRSSHI